MGDQEDPRHVRLHGPHLQQLGMTARRVCWRHSQSNVCVWFSCPLNQHLLAQPHVSSFFYRNVLLTIDTAQDGGASNSNTGNFKSQPFSPTLPAHGGVTNDLLDIPHYKDSTGRLGRLLRGRRRGDMAYVSCFIRRSIKWFLYCNPPATASGVSHWNWTGQRTTCSGRGSTWCTGSWIHITSRCSNTPNVKVEQCTAVSDGDCY